MTVGVLWTAAITPLLPIPAGIGVAYRVTFESLGVMTGVGLFWELTYHGLQQLRWDKDWPSLLALLTVVNEATLLWFVEHALGVIPGTVGWSSPMMVPFVIHIVTTWVLIWIVTQGPLRVLHVRWRFEGGRVLVSAPARRRRPDRLAAAGATDGQADGVGEVAPEGAVADAADPAVLDQQALDQPAKTVAAPVMHTVRQDDEVEGAVDGVVCLNGHFGHVGSRYCTVCGSALLPTIQDRVSGPRPPLGILILDDGRTQVVNDRLVVVPSDTPGGVDLVPACEVRELAMAEITLIGWQPVVSSTQRPIRVTLTDGGNLRVAPRVPVPLVAGAEYKLGDHVLRYESPHVEPDPLPDFVLSEPRPRRAAAAGRTSGRLIALSPRGKRVVAGVAAGIAAGAVVVAAIGVGLLGDQSDNATRQGPGPAPTRTRRNPGTTSQRPTVTPTAGTTPVAPPPGTPAPNLPIFYLRPTSSEHWPLSTRMTAANSSPPATTVPSTTSPGSPTTSTTAPSEPSEPPPTTIAPPRCLLGMVSIQPCPVQ